ncbi:hypothetical protein OAS19_00315 [Altererythrobacter sp.]|nr:hypothetical protein [Altererythrobacter sp.]
MKQNYSLRPGEKGEWISALEAVHLLSPKIGGDKKAKKALVERLLDSAIHCTAWWLAKGYDVGQPYIGQGVTLPDDFASLSEAALHDLTVEQSQPVISETKFGTNYALSVRAGNIFIGGQFWNLATKEDREQWSWANGLFKCSYPNVEAIAGFGEPLGPNSPKSRIRLYALGVHFHRPHVLGIVAKSAGEPARADTKPSNAGRKPSELWANWVAEVIWLQDNEDIEKFSANKLKDRIEDIAAKKGVLIPAPSSVYPAAQRVLSLLKEKRFGRS